MKFLKYILNNLREEAHTELVKFEMLCGQA
jgi:hypothetical protein